MLHLWAVQEALDVLDNPEQTLALNLLGIPLEDRPSYLQKLMPALMSRQGATGRPHWIVIDEAHHVFPDAGASAEWKLTEKPDALLFVTLDPLHLSADFLTWVDVGIFLGPKASETLNAFLKRVGRPPVEVRRNPTGPPEALLWERSKPSESLWCARSSSRSRLSTRFGLRTKASSRSNSMAVIGTSLPSAE